MSFSIKKFSKSNKFFFTCAILGCIQAGIGAFLVKNHKTNPPKKKSSINLPKVTLFKPLAGNEPLLFEALQSFCEQNYPDLQIIFGIQKSNDPAIHVIEKLQKQYPTLDICLVINETIHGLNRKVSNLINMVTFAKHDIFIISDSDIHAPHPHYLMQMVIGLDNNQTGLITSPYSGLTVSANYTQQLAAAHINYVFLPGVLLSRHLGRQDCLGATIAIKRNLLNNLGGFNALLQHVADDAILGRLVRSKGLEIELTSDIIQTTVTESNTKELFEHELRWNRTTATLEPTGFILSFLQLPLFWATLSIIFNPLTWASWFCFILCWVCKSICCVTINKRLKIDSVSILALLPYRDWLSAIIMTQSLLGRNVKWRGQKMIINKHPEFQSTPYDDK